MDPNQVGSISSQNKTNKPKQAKDAVADVAHQAKEEFAKGAQKVKEQVSHRAEEQAEEQKNRAVGRIDHVTHALNRFAEELRDNDEPWLGEQARSLASSVQRASDTLRRKQTREIVDDVRGWSRNPVMFLGGAFAIGLAAGRFLKSSARHTSDDEPDYLERSFARSEELRTNQRWGTENDIYATPPTPAIPRTDTTLGGAPTTTSKTVSVGNGNPTTGRTR